MTKEELKKKCEERAKIFQQAMESCHSSSPMDCIEWFADRITELEAQIEKMKCCGNCKYYQFQNDAGYYTCTRDGKRNGKNYRSCEFNLEKWEGR